MAHGRYPSLTPPPYQAIPLQVPSRVLTVDPFSMQAGAVNFAAGSQMFGPSASPPTLPIATSFQFVQGVLSFWARYDSSKSAFGSSAKILLSGATGGQPNNHILTSCSNQDPGPPGMGQTLLIGSIAVLMGPLSIDVYLVDFTTGNGLLGLSFHYTDPNFDAAVTNQWIRLGTFRELLLGDGVNNVFWNGTNYGAEWVLTSPCGGPVSTFNSGALRMPKYDSVAEMLADPTLIPPHPPESATVRNGPDPQSGTIYDTPADVYIVIQTLKGGSSPTSGWHHYIISFDTSQLVTDANGAQTIRAQMAMDGAGGPVQGGPLMDTKAQGITLASQPFFNWLPQQSVTGKLLISTSDAWSAEAPDDAPVDFAYLYFGVSLNGQGFYDLTVPGNMHRFFTATGAAANFGRGGTRIPLDGVFMHTGDMGQGNIGTPLAPIFAANFPTNAVAPFIPAFPNDPTKSGTIFNAWRTLGRLTSTDGPPVDSSAPF